MFLPLVVATGGGLHPPGGWGVADGSVCLEKTLLYFSSRLCLPAQ